MDASTDTGWVITWQVRGKSYHEANSRFPQVRDQERDLMLLGLDLHPQLMFLDVAAGGGYQIEKAYAQFGNTLRYFAIEPSETFAQYLPQYVQRLSASTITAFELDDSSVDRVANLSGLHHTGDIDLFFAESYRVLRAGGLCGVADVRRGSIVDAWLNGFVNEYNSEGHQGVFFDPGDFTRKMTLAGFEDIRESYNEYTWDFESLDQMSGFLRLLFGLDLADQRKIVEGVSDILGYTTLPTGEIRMNWGLIYTFGVNSGE